MSTRGEEGALAAIRAAEDTRGQPTARPLPVEVVVLWVLLAVVATEILTTYTRVPAAELYYVTGSGLGLAIRQTLLFVGFPAGLVAVLLAGVSADRRSPRAALLLTAVMAVAAITAVVGAGVDEVDADVRTISILAVGGVAIAAALSMAAARGGLAPLRRLPGDRLRVIAALALALLAIPWMLADLGFAVDQVPGLNRVFISEAVRPDPGRPLPFSAVHDGHHHGMDGVLLAWSALLGSRLLAGLGTARLRGALGPYVALLLVFGTANAAQDFWTEQVVKRGLVSYELPRFTAVSVDVKWLLLLVITIGVHRTALRPGGLLARGPA